MRVIPTPSVPPHKEEKEPSSIGESSGKVYQSAVKATPTLPRIFVKYSLLLIFFLLKPLIFVFTLGKMSTSQKENAEDTPVNSSPALTGELERQLHTTVTEFMKAHHIPSVTIGLVINGEIAYKEAFGDAKKLIPGVNDIPVASTTQTTYRLASLTKQFTATAIMKLVEQGKIDLDTSIKKYIPNAPSTWEKVTVRDLIYHNGGFAYQLPIAEYPTLKEQDQYPTPESYLHILTSQEPQPGKHIYSNIGYELLGMIIKEVAQKSYSAYLEETFFDPLKMKQTNITSNIDNTENFAIGYAYENQKLMPLNLYPDIVQEDIPLAGAGISSSLTDLFKWEQALQSDAFLSKESQAVLWGEEGESVWNVGHTEKGDPMLAVSGAGWGYNTSFVRFPAKNAAVIVLSNLNGTGPNGANIPELTAKLADLLHLS